MRRVPPSNPNAKHFQRPGVVFQPETASGMQAGINQLADLVAPTLGPLPHIVANERNFSGRGKMPEMLDSGGTIARRIIQIPDRVEDVGFMFLRHVLWKLQENEGDGTATTAVMFREIYNHGLRYLAAGGSPMALRGLLERGRDTVLAELDRQVTQLHGKHSLAGLARTICYDDELAKMLGEIFDIIGPFGRLDVRKGESRELIREYVEGMYWESPLRSREMANSDYGLRAALENPAVLISDLDIDTPEQLAPLLSLAVRSGINHLLLVSNTLSDKALGMLLYKPNREKVTVVAVKAPGGSTPERVRDALDDLAILTGGRVLNKATADRLEKVRLEDLGRARRVWADASNFGIIGGRGEPRTLRQHIAGLRSAFRSATDPDDRKHLLTRLGKLMGGSATLYVGGSTPTDIEARVELAKRTADAMRGAMREGVVPGGGTALLACRAALRAQMTDTQDSDERAALNMLVSALEAPFKTLLANAGHWHGRILAEVERQGEGWGYDISACQVVDMRAAGIYDAASVVKAAARAAISSAALGLTTEAIVQRKNPPEALNT